MHRKKMLYEHCSKNALLESYNKNIKCEKIADMQMHKVKITLNIYLINICISNSLF